MNSKKIDVKYFYGLIIVCIVLGACLVFALKGDKKPNNTNSTGNEVSEEEVAKELDVNDEYERIFNSFAGKIAIMDTNKKSVKLNDIDDEAKLDIVKGLLTKKDYVDSKEMSDFNDEIAKYRTIKKSTIQNYLTSYFNSKMSLPDSFFIFPYDYTLVDDQYVGEAIITGMEMGDGWYYQAATYILTKTKLSIIGFAYYNDFMQYCADELCNNVVESATYENLVDYKDSFPKVVVNFTVNEDGSYRFVNEEIGD